MSNQTKQQLSGALKTLLSRKTVDKITIGEITDLAQVSRKTFYYHFTDIYDLIEWTLMDDAARVFQEHIDLKDWQNDLIEVARYFYENRSLVLNAYNSISRDVLESYIEKIVSPLVALYYQDNHGSQQLTPQDETFIVDLYTFGIVGYFLRWINAGMKSVPYELINQLFRFFTGTMQGMAEHGRQLETKA